jgi:hypothetical protein
VFAAETLCTVTAGLRALPFVVMMTTGSTYAFAQRDFARLSAELRSDGYLTCYPIRPGDTAAGLAHRFTGNAHNRYQPWFQIVNPATATFVSKSRYGAIQSGWHVCVATEMLRYGSARRQYHVVSSTPLMWPQTAVTQQRTAIDPSVLWWAAGLFVSGLVLAHVLIRRYIRERRASLDIMRGFGDKFISEFERPLFRRSADVSPIKSRLRFAPARHRLEVLLAPAAGRTYPNLLDHRKNVEYDVERVLRLLRDEPFVHGPLYAKGPWVVIPFRFETGSNKKVCREYSSSELGRRRRQHSALAEGVVPSGPDRHAEDRSQVRGAAQASRHHAIPRHQ